MASRPQYRGEVYQSGGSASRRCHSRFWQSTEPAARLASVRCSPEELVRPRAGGADASERRMHLAKRYRRMQRRNPVTVKALAALLSAPRTGVDVRRKDLEPFGALSGNLSAQARPRGILRPGKLHPQKPTDDGHVLAFVVVVLIGAVLILLTLLIQGSWESLPDVLDAPTVIKPQDDNRTFPPGISQDSR